MHEKLGSAFQTIAQLTSFGCASSTILLKKDPFNLHNMSGRTNLVFTLPILNLEGVNAKAWKLLLAEW